MSTASVLKPIDRSIKSPFRGFPRTGVTVGANGETCITVKAHALTPARARLSFFGGVIAGTALFASGTYDLAADGLLTIEAFGKLIVATTAAFPVSWFGLRQIVKKCAIVTFTPARIRVRTAFRLRSFERSHPHGFVLLPHDKADKERDRHAFLDRKRPPKWWSWNRKKYYGESFHVVFQCFGERHDVLTVYGRKKAEAIHARLQACDAVMNGVDFGDSGVSLSPHTDWRVEAGGL